MVMQEAFCVMDRNGFRFTVQKSNVLQAHVYLKKELFSFFDCETKQQFGVNLSVLLECLNIFNSSSNFVALQISYAGHGRPLLLEMADGGVVSSSGVATIDNEDPVDFCWQDNPVVHRAIIQSTPLREALTELNWWGTSLQLRVSPNAPHIQMTSKGQNGTCEIQFPSSCEAIDEFSSREDKSTTYRFTLIQSVFKALGLSEKVCLRVNEVGMLSLQLMIRDDSPITTFVEFLICADIVEDDLSLTGQQG